MNNSCPFPELNHNYYKLSVKIQEASRPKILSTHLTFQPPLKEKEIKLIKKRNTISTT